MLQSEAQIRCALAAAGFLELVTVATARVAAPRGVRRRSVALRLQRGLQRRATPKVATTARFPPVSVPDLEELGLDVVIALQPFDGLRQYATAARYGVWWFAAAPSEDPSASEARHLCSALGRAPAAESLWFSCGAAPQVLDFASARPRSDLFVAKNLEALVPVRCELLLAALRRVRHGGIGAAPSRTYPEVTESASAGPARAVGSATLLGEVARTLVKKLYGRVRPTPWKEQYSVALRPRGPREGSYASVEDYAWLALQTGSWIADPFLATRDGRDYLFVEQMIDADGRARLVCTEIDSQGRTGAFEPVLQRPYHLSYPHVFAHQGEFFMIPESGIAGKVELYRARSFPLTWELVRVLYQGRAFDTSVHHDGEQFWFFTSIIADQFALASQLMLFRSNRLDGDWIGHPANPVCSDVRFARGAGRIFRSGELLLRPAQDCSISYGGSMSFRTIDVLSESAYRESPRAAISLAKTGMVGPHTYDRSDLHEVIDGRLLVPRRGTASPSSLRRRRMTA